MTPVSGRSASRKPRELLWPHQEEHSQPLDMPGERWLRSETLAQDRCLILRENAVGSILITADNDPDPGIAAQAGSRLGAAGQVDLARRRGGLGGQ
jgi:hypothetical protein